MKYLICAVLCALSGLTVSPLAAQPYAIPANCHRIVILGNSITYAGGYVNYIDTRLTMKNPAGSPEIINVGLPSETVSGLSEPNHAGGKFPRPDLHERLARVLKALKPDLVLACYGMNDGIYMNFDAQRFNAYCEGIEWLHREVTASGADIVMITPPVYDHGAAYANVLDIYSDWLLSKRYTSGWKVIDIHWPMRKYLEDARVTDPSFVLANDGVHPGDTGHFLMAKTILAALADSALLKFPDGKAFRTQNATTDSLFSSVAKRQELLKLAWLTSTGHKRPGIPKGLPVEVATQKSDSIKIRILRLNQNL